MSLHNVTGRYDIAAQEDRSAPRTRLAIRAQLRQSGGRPFQTIVNDLSLSGFSATSVGRMHVGTVCWLTLPGPEALQAEVIWWEDSLCGCAFASMLSSIVHDNVIARYRAGEI